MCVDARRDPGISNISRDGRAPIMQGRDSQRMAKLNMAIGAREKCTGPRLIQRMESTPFADQNAKTTLEALKGPNDRCGVLCKRTFHAITWYYSCSRGFVGVDTAFQPDTLDTFTCKRYDRMLV